MLDERVNRNDLLYRYKDKSPDVKFDKYDNAIDLFNKIHDGRIKRFDAKNDQIKFKSHLEEIKKGNKKQQQQQQQIKRAKKHTIQYWNVLQIKKQGY